MVKSDENEGPQQVHPEDYLATLNLPSLPPPDSDNESIFSVETVIADHNISYNPLSPPEDFNFRDHRHAISGWGFLIHTLKSNIGTGILAMPEAIKNSGLWVGSVGLVIISIICVECMHMLVRNANSLCHRANKSFLTFEEVAFYSFKFSSAKQLNNFANFAKNTIRMLLVITQVGFCSVYLTFVANSMDMILRTFSIDWSHQIELAILLLPCLLLVSVRNLRYMAPISMAANLLQFLGYGIIFYYVFQDLPSVTERNAYASFSQYALYFGTAMYAFEGIGTVLPLENQMKRPNALRGWCGVLNISFVVITTMYIAVGFFGYLKYGENVKGSITLNLPESDPLALSVVGIMAIAIFLSYSIQFYVPVEIILPNIQNKLPERFHTFTDFAFRYALVLLTYGFAAVVPNLGLFISLVGAVGSTTLALIAPPIMDWATYWPDQGRFYFRTIKNSVILLFGTIGFVAGTYVSIRDLSNYYSSQE